MNIRDYTLTAGQAFNTEGGKQFLLAEAVNPVDIIFYGQSGGDPVAEVTQVKGGFKKTFPGRVLGARIVSATGQAIKYGWAEDGDAEYLRSQGDVNATLVSALEEVTVNKLLERDISRYYDTLNNQNTFSFDVYEAGALGVYSYVAIGNPLGSVKTLVLQSVYGNTDGTSAFHGKIFAGNLNNLMIRSLAKKNTAGADPVAAVGQGQNVTALIGGTNSFMGGRTPADDPKEFLRGDSVILNANEYLLLESIGVDVGLDFKFEWKEI